MNLPNKLTMFRIILIPFFVIAMMLISKDTMYFVYVSLIIYVIASFTDQLDGYISRKYNLITDFGKIMDPLADKLLVAAGFVMLTGMGIVPAWITVIVICRDFIMNAVRMFSAGDKVVIAAAWSGKVKTAFQLIGVCLAILDILNINGGFFAFVNNYTSYSMFELVINAGMSISILIAVIATIYSLIEYLSKYMKYIDYTK